MNREQAMFHALGYSSGHADASNIPTVPSATDPELSRHYAFAEAYANGWDAVNTGRRHYMPCVDQAYETWQKSGGRTIFDPIFQAFDSIRDSEPASK